MKQVGRKIAISSTGPYSGKTTLAKYLEKEYGFVRADHSRTIIEDFIGHWNAQPEHFQEQLTVDQVYANKEYFRQGLQEHSLRVGVSSPEKAEYWTRQTLIRAGCSITQARCPGSTPLVCPDKDVVFEPFRGEVQADVMRRLGFTLAQLDIPAWVRRHRARLLGKDYDQIEASMQAHPELEGGIERPDVCLDGVRPTAVLARALFWPHVTYSRQ